MRLRWYNPDVENRLGYDQPGFTLPPPPDELDYKLVTAFIKKCTSVSQVSGVLQATRQNLSPITIAVALLKIGYLYDPPSPQNNQKQNKDLKIAHKIAFDYFVKNIDKFQKWEMVVVLWGMVKSECQNKEFYKFWLKKAATDIQSFSARSISLAIWCLGYRGWDQSLEETLFTDAAIQNVQTNIGDYEGMDISMMLVALAKNEAQTGDPLIQRLFTLTAQREIQVAAEQSTQGLVNTLWAYARLRIPAPDMVAQINYQIQLRPSELIPQQIAVLLWSYMRLSFFDKKTFQILAQRVNEGIEEFTPQGISGIMYSFCWYIEHFTIEHEKMFVNGKDLFKSRIHEFEPIHISNMLFAYSTVSTVRGEDLFDVAVELLEFAIDRVIRDFQKFDIYCVSIIALSYGRMGLADDQLFDLIQLRIKKQINDFKITNLVTLLYGIVMSGRQEKQTVKLIIRKIMVMGQSLLQQKYLQMLQKSLNNIRVQDEDLQQLVQKCQSQLGYQRWERIESNQSAFQNWLKRSNSLSYYDNVNQMSYGDENMSDKFRYDDEINDGTDY